MLLLKIWKRIHSLYKAMAATTASLFLPLELCLHLEYCSKAEIDVLYNFFLIKDRQATKHQYCSLDILKRNTRGAYKYTNTLVLS